MTLDARTEGERWTRDALRGLQSRGYSVGGWVEFLRASWGRAAATRRARPDLARQARGWCAIGAVAAILQPRRRLALAWWGGVSLMLDWHLGMVETEAGEARRLGPADALTLTRAWLVPLAAAGARPGVLAAGFASDALDGPLARRSSPTRAGRDLEGAVDAAFTAAALRGAVRSGALGRVAAGAEALRLAAGVAATTRAYFAGAQPPPAELARAARATTPVRAAGLLAAAAGRRRAADALVIGGAVVAIAARRRVSRSAARM